MGLELSKVKRETVRTFNRSNFARLHTQVPKAAGNLTRFVNPKRKTRKVLILSLDAAGKTTLLFYLKNRKIINTIPTIGYNHEEIEYKKAVYSLWDIGGQDAVRQFWIHYFVKVNGLIFIVDSNDRERLSEARDVFTEVVNYLRSNDAHFRCPILILANKQDLSNCMTKEEIYDGLELNHFTDVRHAILSCSITKGIGTDDILEWLHKEVKK